MKKDDIRAKLEEEHILSELVRLGLGVRSELQCHYDVKNHKNNQYRNYRGLCDIACELFKNEFNQYCRFHKLYKGLTLEIIHGEQRHTPRIPTQYWGYQHTWLRVYRNGKPFCYLDFTAQQFQFLYHDIPDYYCAKKAPKWYYPDRRNPVIRLYRISKDISAWLDRMEYRIWGDISNAKIALRSTYFSIM